MIISLFETVRLSVSNSPRNLYNSLKSVKENNAINLFETIITQTSLWALPSSYILRLVSLFLRVDPYWTKNQIMWEWIIDLRKSNFSSVWISGSISLTIREEHVIHCMPCSSRIMWDEMTIHICYHSNYGVLSTLAESYLGDVT